ncbi:hypothetical protein VF12_37860 [Nostoc linckia z15]|nr:hypothetical protein VF12_37860 [Nostoc linckia z15]
MTETVYVEEYMIAPAGVRFGNLFIDIIVQAVLAYAVGFLSVLAGELLDWDSQYIWFRKMDRGDAVFFLLTIHVLYYMLFEGLWQLTPGQNGYGYAGSYYRRPKTIIRCYSDTQLLPPDTF